MSTLQENRSRQITVTGDDLPLHCPMPNMVSWNQHPRVYLPIAAQGGTALCPFCGTHYTLTGEVKSHH